MATLQELRALAKRRHDAATAKVGRLKRQDVVVTGTAFDPRRNRQNINKYNRRQLETYIRELNEFTDRSTRFVAGRRGAPIPRETWETFERAQRAVNIRAEKYYAPHTQRVLPTRNITIGQRLADNEAMDFNVLRMGRGVSNMPYAPSYEKPSDYADPEAIRKTERALRRRLKPNYMKRTMKARRRSADLMTRMIGDETMREQLRQLNDDQFDLLWNFTGFAEGIKVNYEQMKQGETRQFEAQIAEDHMMEGRLLIEWVKEQPL